MNENRLPKMARFTILTALLFAIGLLIETHSPRSFFGILLDFGFVGLVFSFFYYCFLTFRWLKQKLLWKVRNKIIISYAFVGILPLLLLLAINWLLLVVIFKQLSGLYLQTELENIENLLRQASDSTLLGYYSEASTRSPEALASRCREQLERLPRGFANARCVLLEGDGALFSVSTGEGDSSGQKDEALAVQTPSWLSNRYSGLIDLQGQVHLSSLARIQESDRVLAILLPLDSVLLSSIHRRTAMQVEQIHATGGLQTEFSRFFDSQSLTSVGAAHFFRPVSFESGLETDERVLLISIPFQTLVDHFFARAAGSLVFLTIFLVALFLIIELIALLIGIFIARSITRSVHQIDTGTHQIRQGDLQYRIPVKNQDQLGSMASSFNQMADSIVELTGEVARKEWLEKEMEIAEQVQSQLFPKGLPKIEGIQVAAQCVPARQVSGDYYDFIPYETHRLDVVFGDISGKGISAALLMASTQSTIRNQLLSLHPDSENRIQRAVADVNRNLYKHSTPEAFSTLVLSHYDSESGQLSYCNAGHPPPLHFRGTDQLYRLGRGGTVVGLFEDWEYEQATVELQPGDLILYFTDGVIEAENQAGQQFEEERLIDLVRSNLFLTVHDIEKLIVDEVFAWADGQEQADDITVACVKVTREI